MQLKDFPPAAFLVQLMRGVSSPAVELSARIESVSHYLNPKNTKEHLAVRTE